MYVALLVTRIYLLIYADQINCAGLGNPSMPFGGYKQSGIGRELGEEGLYE